MDLGQDGASLAPVNEATPRALPMSLGRRHDPDDEVILPPCAGLQLERLYVLQQLIRQRVPKDSTTKIHAPRRSRERPAMREAA